MKFNYLELNMDTTDNCGIQNESNKIYGYIEKLYMLLKDTYCTDITNSDIKIKLQYITNSIKKDIIVRDIQEFINQDTIYTIDDISIADHIILFSYITTIALDIGDIAIAVVDDNSITGYTIHFYETSDITFPDIYIFEKLIEYIHKYVSEYPVLNYLYDKFNTRLKVLVNSIDGGK